MRIVDANAAIRIARWAYAHRGELPEQVRADIALLAEVAGKKLRAGLLPGQLEVLRLGIRDVHLPEDGDHQ